MSTLSHLRGFAARAAAARAAWFDSAGDGDCASLNFSYTAADGTVIKFRAPFTLFANQREAMDAGFQPNVQARLMLPLALGVPLSSDPAAPTDFTALTAGDGFVAGDVFRVVWFLRHPAAAETRVGLRKLDLA